MKHNNMNRPVTRTVALAVMLAALLILASCTASLKSLDVVGQQSITSFDAILKAVPDKVQPDSLNVGWALSAPDDAARFIWSEDYSRSPQHDVMIELDAQPFLDAGLDPAQLPEYYVYYESSGMSGMGAMGPKMIMLGVDLGSDQLTYTGQPTAIAAYEQIVNKYRDTIGFHTSLDHYGVKLGNGNMFEWAKDMKTNGFDKTVQDKDIVFVLNPEPLIAAGVDPEQVEGWAYAQVTVDEDGKTVDVWKFLRPYDLQ